MKPLALSRMLLARDWKAGELRLLLAALAVAVAAIATVGVFVDRLGQALTTQARQLLGADIVVSSDRPLSDDWIAEAARRGLRSARTIAFPSMAPGRGRTRCAGPDPTGIAEGGLDRLPAAWRPYARRCPR